MTDGCFRHKQQKQKQQEFSIPVKLLVENVKVMRKYPPNIKGLCSDGMEELSPVTVRTAGSIQPQ